MIAAPSAEATRPDSHAPITDWLLQFRFEESSVRADGAEWADHGKVSAFVAGVIFDREEMAALGQQTTANGDAALIAAAYARVGEKMIPRLWGSFVVAIIDRSRRCAIVVRDPLGLHPLYHAEAGGTIRFAPSIDRLLRTPGVSRDLNRAAIADQLCRRLPALDETHYAAVRRVPQGWLVRLESNRTTFERYWNAPDDFEWLSEA